MSPEDVLKAMANHAVKLADDSRYTVREMAANNQYIRISGGGYRAVSLNSQTPLCRYSDGPTESLDEIFDEFIQNPVPMEVAPEQKPERCLQRYIIKASLLHGRDLRRALALTDCPYDELVFALDEVSLGGVRCDILAVGRIGTSYYPVVIELKSNRSKQRLLEQLDNFTREISTYGKWFSTLLANVTGIHGVSMNTGRPHKIIIWPIADSESKSTGKGFGSSSKAQMTRDDLSAQRISLIEYDEFDNDNESVQCYPTWAEIELPPLR